MVELNDIITSLEDWKTGKGILLYSNGDTFCSGGYLETVKQICYPQGGFKMATLMHDTTTKFRRIPFVSLSVVQGKVRRLYNGICLSKTPVTLSLCILGPWRRCRAALND